MAFINLGQIIYPVNSYYMTTNSESPAQSFGGTWSQLAVENQSFNIQSLVKGNNSIIQSQNWPDIAVTGTCSGNWVNIRVTRNPANAGAATISGSNAGSTVAQVKEGFRPSYLVTELAGLQNGIWIEARVNPAGVVAVYTRYTTSDIQVTEFDVTLTYPIAVSANDENFNLFKRIA